MKNKVIISNIKSTSLYFVGSDRRIDLTIDDYVFTLSEYEYGSYLIDKFIELFDSNSVVSIEIDENNIIKSIKE